MSVDTPDSLQDLCIFYFCNNLPVLESSLDNVTEQTDDAPTTLTTQLSDKILNHYLKCHVGEDDVAKDILDKLLKNDRICHSLCLNRRDILTFDNVEDAAQNHIKQLEVTYFNEFGPLCITTAVECLVKNNLSSLASVKLNTKTNSSDYTRLLKLLAGENVEGVKSLTKTRKENVIKDMDCGDSAKHAGTTKYNSETQDNIGKGEQGCQSLDNAQTSGDIYNTKLNPKGVDVPSVRQNENLHSSLIHFTFIECYDIRGPVNKVAFLPMLKVLKRNLQLQTLCIVSRNQLLCNHILGSNVLVKMRNLRSLILSSEVNPNSVDTLAPGSTFKCLPELQHLRHLDLSRNDPKQLYKYLDADVTSFIQAVKDMPKLMSIELAGTNLSQIVGHKNDEDKCSDHCMPGFEGRTFEYIGLFNCQTEHHRYIPAIKVSGSSNEKELLVSMWSYHHNKSIMHLVLKQVRKAVSDGIITKATPFIEAIMIYLEEISDSDFSYSQQEGGELQQLKLSLTIIYYLSRLEREEIVTIKQKRAISHLYIIHRRRLERVLVLLDNGIRDRYKDVLTNSSTTVLHTAIIILLIFKLEKVAVYCHMYVPYVNTIMNVYNNRTVHNTRMLCLRLIHEAVRVSQEHKVIAGNTCELVQVLLTNLREIMLVLCEDEQDDTMELFEKMWSIIWTLTDEVDSNSRLFLKYLGHIFSLQCFKQFPESHDLHRKMSGAMANVCEFADCRQEFMTPDIVQMFRDMLVVDCNEDTNYDVSSHAAGALLMLTSDGPDVWADRAPNPLTIPSRDTILEEIDNIIKKWDINKSKGVKFRSLTVMLDQIENSSTPVAQYWGAWMICNLLILEHTCETFRYSVMLKCENGEAIILRTLEQHDLREDVRDLLEQILQLSGMNQCHEQHREMNTD